jgi:hypothetical protein
MAAKNRGPQAMKNILISASLLVAMATPATAQSVKKSYAQDATSKSIRSVELPHHKGRAPGPLAGGAQAGPGGSVGEQLKQLERQTNKAANAPPKTARTPQAEKLDRETVQKRGGINFAYQAPKTGSHSTGSAHGSGSSQIGHRTTRQQ